MSRWFRLHDCVLDDPKVQRLAPPLFKTWINLLCVASRNEGMLPNAIDLSFMLRLSEGIVRSQIEALIAAGLIDETFDGGLTPHKWSERQFKSDVSTDRVKRFRQRSMKHGKPVPATPPDTETDTDTDKSPSQEVETYQDRYLQSSNGSVDVDRPKVVSLARGGLAS